MYIYIYMYIIMFFGGRQLAIMCEMDRGGPIWFEMKAACSTMK